MSPEQAHVGDVLQYRVELAEGVKEYRHPDFSESPCELLAPPETQDTGWLYKVACYRTGELRLPPPRVASEGFLRPAAPIGVLVRSVLPEGPLPALRPEKALLPAPKHPARVFLPVLGAALLAAGVVWWRRKRRNRAVVLPAHVKALQALQRLEAEQWIERGDTEAYCVAVSQVVRAYWEERFAVRAPEMTTEEFLQQALDEPSLSRDQRQQLQDFMGRCDLAKFAHARLSREELLDLAASAESLIRQTQPSEHAEERG